MGVTFYATLETIAQRRPTTEDELGAPRLGALPAPAALIFVYEFRFTGAMPAELMSIPVME